MILVILFLLLSCKTIVLKKEFSIPPFKVKAGSYEIDIFNIDYPKILGRKIDFFNSFYDLLKVVIKNKKKISLALNEEFIKDFISIEKNGLLEVESFIGKSASDLDNQEKDNLIDLLKREKREYKSQELLNFQVEALYKILRRSDLFDNSKNYTELNKERVLDNLRVIRARIVKAINNFMIELVIIIENPYSKKEYNTTYKKYYYSKYISFSRNLNLSDVFNQYKKYGIILFKGIKEKDMIKILNSEIDLEMDYFITENNYLGYKYLINKSVMFFEGGQNYIKTFRNYDIKIKLKNCKIEDIKDLNSITIRELFIEDN